MVRFEYEVREERTAGREWTCVFLFSCKRVFAEKQMQTLIVICLAERGVSVGRAVDHHLINVHFVNAHVAEHQCTLCEKAYTVRRDLLAHLRTVHKQLPDGEQWPTNGHQLRIVRTDVPESVRLQEHVDVVHEKRRDQ